MKKIYTLLPPLLAALATLPVEAQTVQHVPRVVVTITIDRLRTDYMNAFLPLYGEDGFNRLLNEGRVYSRAEYPQSRLNRAACIATVATGTVPYNHGIVAEEWLDRNTLRPVQCVDDDEHEGLLTGEKSSPRFLSVSTVSDELKVATQGKALVYGIAPFRDAAILSAGHAADGAFWINPLTGKWCSTSYYNAALPAWALMQNAAATSLSNTIDDVAWKPLNDFTGNFNYFPSGGMKTPFSYRFKGSMKFRQFLTSGLVNDCVADMACACVEQSTMGTDEVTDYLAVTFYAGNYEDKPAYDFPLEIQDIYARLDRALGRFMQAVEKKAGRENVLFVLTSTGYSDDETSDLAKYRIPTGTFNISRTAGLLNIYLTALYGAGQYVEAAHGNELFLSHKLLETKQLSLGTVMERAQELLLQLEGVKDVYTSARLLSGAWTPGISRIRNSYNTHCSGDIMIEVAPGWQLVNEDTGSRRLIRESYVPFPIIFLGQNLKPEKIDTPVETACIAPTLTQVMRIRAPNACTAAAFPGFNQ